MEDVRITDWPEPPGSHAWLPAYGFQHDLLDKDDYLGTNGECQSRLLWSGASRLFEKQKQISLVERGGFASFVVFDVAYLKLQSLSLFVIAC